MTSLAQEFRSIEPSNGQSRCVVVENLNLIHTGQIHGAGQGDIGFDSQLSQALKRIRTAIESAGLTFENIARMNVYVANILDVDRVSPALHNAFPGPNKPTVSVVVTALPWKEAVVAIDSVICCKTDVVARAGKNSSGFGASFACLNRGTRVYISGQAEKGDGSLFDATLKTLESLQRTLEFLGLSKKDVVQVKCFLGPMLECEKAKSAIEQHFESVVPPCVFVEWISNLPIEIEMIVDASRTESLKHGPSVEVRTPPGMTTPTVYSRLTIARHPMTIYTSGLYPSDSSLDAEKQLRSIFTNLKQSLDLSGSDWMHLVKATYYVSDEQLSKWHNTVRPDYFSPRRPPAASKAMVKHVGRTGHGIMMEFVAVPGD